MSEFYQSLSHFKWDCKYHVIFMPKGRWKAELGLAERHARVTPLASSRSRRIVAIPVGRAPSSVRTSRRLNGAPMLSWITAIIPLWGIRRSSTGPFSDTGHGDPGDVD